MYNDSVMQEEIDKSADDFLWRKEYVVRLNIIGFAEQQGYEDLVEAIK